MPSLFRRGAAYQTKHVRRFEATCVAHGMRLSYDSASISEVTSGSLTEEIISAGRHVLRRSEINTDRRL